MFIVEGGGIFERETKGNTCLVSEEKYGKRGEEEQLENTCITTGGSSWYQVLVLQVNPQAPYILLDYK